jgi:cysteine desulfurase family protein
MESTPDTGRPRIYLDNAATSWPKPASVYAAVDHFQRDLGASAGRGGYQSSLRSRQIVESTRDLVRQLFHVPAGYEICFGFNGTDVLNLCLHGWLRNSAHVITSVAEHNSVLRPLTALKERLGLDVSYAECDAEGRVDPDSIRKLIRPETQLVALTHASNVTGTIQPIAEVSRIARDHGIRFLVDAAQTAGHIPINLEVTPVEMLATSGHKGLLGPLGTGIVCLASEVAGRLEPIRQGGTGSSSDDDRQPNFLPDRFEAGNHNLPGIAGLRAGLEFVLSGLEANRNHEIQLADQLAEGLRSIPNLTLFGPHDCRQRVGVVGFTLEGWDCHELASTLDVAESIEVRSGLMCAPRMHVALGCPQGTVRASVGPFNTTGEVAKLIETLRTIA